MAAAAQRRRPLLQHCRCPQILRSPALFLCIGTPAAAGKQTTPSTVVQPKVRVSRLSCLELRRILARSFVRNPASVR